MPQLWMSTSLRRSRSRDATIGKLAIRNAGGLIPPIHKATASWNKVRNCGDQRVSPRFVFNELSHFLFVDSWRSCWIAQPVVSFIGHTSPFVRRLGACEHTSALAPFSGRPQILLG